MDKAGREAGRLFSDESETICRRLKISRFSNRIIETKPR